MPRVLFWRVDEFAIIVVPIFLGLLIGSILFMTLGFLLKPFYSRLKKKYPRGTLKHKLYWHLPTSIVGKMGICQTIPPSHKRELLL